MYRERCMTINYLANVTKKKASDTHKNLGQQLSRFPRRTYGRLEVAINPQLLTPLLNYDINST